MLNSESLRNILSKYKTVAVVGLSRDPSKDSYRVAKYLKEHGFRIVPVNPGADEILGEKSYKTLSDMPEEVQKTLEIVDIFRPSDKVLPVTEQAILLRKRYGLPHVVWMQLGIINKKAAEKAREAGLKVIMDKCMMKEHKQLFSRQ